MHPNFRRRKQFGLYYHLIKELNIDDAQFHKYFRMNKAQVDTKQGQDQHSGNTFLRHNLEFPIWISGISGPFWLTFAFAFSIFRSLSDRVRLRYT